jgi:hypothetical protein
MNRSITWIRHPRQFEKVKSYIEWNPVRAGLVVTPEQWPYSSATAQRDVDSQAEACATIESKPAISGESKPPTPNTQKV